MVPSAESMSQIPLCNDEGADLLQGATMKSDYLEHLKSEIAARFERDLRKPKVKTAVKPTAAEDATLEQQRHDHFAKLLMAEAVRQLK
jgi:hypothetical protein